MAMATFEVSAPDGRVFEVTAPDGASHDAVLAYAKKHFAALSPERPQDRSFIKPGGYTEDDLKQHATDARRFSSPGAVRRMLDAATLGSADEILAGLGAPIDMVVDRMRGRDVSLSDAYAKNLEVQRQLRDEARNNTKGYGLALDLAGGLLAAPAAGAANVAAMTLPQIAWQGAKIGAPIGGIQAFAGNDGEVSDRVLSMPTGAAVGAAGGAMLAPAIPGTLSMLDRLVAQPLRNMTGRVTGRTPPAAAAAQAASDDFATAGVPRAEQFGPAIGGRPWQATTAESLTGSVAGNPLRARVDRNETLIADHLRDTLQQAGAPVTANDAGRLLQDVARRQTTGRRLPHGYLEGLDETALARYSGLQPPPVAAPSTLPGPSPTRMDLQLQNATTFPDQFAAAYHTLERMTPATMRAPSAVAGSETRTFLEGIRAEGRSRGLIKSDNRNADLFDATNPAYSDIRKQVEAIVPREVSESIYSRQPLSITDMKNMRGEVRRSQTAQPGMRTPDEAAIANVERALSNDMHGLMASRGRSDASDTMRMIDTAYQQHRQAVVEPLVRRVFGDNVPSETALSGLIGAAQGGDLRLLRAMYTAAERGGARNQVTATLLSEMSRDGLLGFVRNVGRIPPEARAVMFAGQAHGLGAAMDNFVRTINRLQPYMVARDAARTGIDISRTPNVIAGVGVAGALTGNLPVFFAALGGQNAIARFMSSPRYVNWLTQAIQIRNPGPANQAWVRHVARLSAIADLNDAFGSLVAESAGALLRPAG